MAIDQIHMDASNSSATLFFFFLIKFIRYLALIYPVLSSDVDIVSKLQVNNAAVNGVIVDPEDQKNLKLGPDDVCLSV